MSTDNFGALGADFFIKTYDKGSSMSQADLDALVQYVQLTSTIMAIGDFTPNQQDSVWMILERVDVPSAPGYTVTNNTEVTMTSGGMVTIDSIPWTKITGKPTLFTANQTLNTSDSVSFNRLTVTGASGIEGGEIELAKAPSSTLAGNVVIDVYENKLRFFEGGGNGRGFYLDLTTGANNTSTNIMSGGAQGPKGDTGDTGPAGAQGPQGERAEEDRLVNGAQEVVLNSDGTLTTPAGLSISKQLDGSAVHIGSTIQSDLDKNLRLQTLGTGSGSLAWQNFEGDANFVTLNYNQSKNIMISVGNAVGEGVLHNWLFASTGNIQLPSGGDIVDIAGNSVLGGGSGATTLSALTDVALEGPVEGSVLTWNDTQGHWENRSLPAASEITNTHPEGPTYSVSVGTDGVVTMVTSRGNLEFGALPEPGGPTHFHIMRPAGDNGTDLYFGDDYNYVLQRPSAYGGAPAYGVEIGANDNNGGDQQVWRFGTDGDLVLPAGKTIRDTSGTDLLADADTLLEPYKGFRAHYGTMWGNTDDENGPINKLVIYKSTASPSSVIDTSTESDDFQVTGLTGSDVVAMLVVVSDGTDWDIQTPTATLKTFVEKIIDEVILDEGVEGDVNTVSAMKSAFYANFSNFNTIIPNVKANLQFFTVNNQFSISPAFVTGDGSTFSGISYNMSNNTLDLGNWGQSQPTTHEVGDVYVIPGNTIQDADNNFLATPDNDVTVTITSAGTGGEILSYSVTGTLPRPAELWPNSIDDGGDDEYDGGNAIHTNLATDISYRGGDVYTEADEFNSNGNSTYVVTYQAGIFGIFATGCDISTIGTSGNDGGYGNDSSSSGFDGDGTAVTGSLYGDSNEVSLGDFMFNNSTLTATGNGGDMFIKAGDDLWLDALDDDIHIRANDDVRIKVGYDFTADTAQQEWRFDTSGYISFPDGTTQSTAYTGSVDYSNINNTPTIPTSFSSLVNGVHTVSLGSTGTLTLPGVLTLPQGTTISDTSNIVTVTLDQLTAISAWTGTLVFTKVSDTLYQALPSGPTMELVSGIWRLRFNTATYYDSTDLITWEAVAGGLPAPVGTLTTVVGMGLTVDGYEWLLDDDGNLTTPSSLVIGSRPGGGSHIQQNDAALEIVGEGANSVVQIGWTANQSAPDSVALIAMNLPNGGEGNVLIAVGNNATTVNYWLFDNAGNLTLPAGGDILDITGASVLGGGTTLPTNASGYLVNDGAGNLSWAAGDGTFSGDYDDLTNKPTIPTDVSDLTDTTNLLFSGSYNDLSNTPALFDGDYVNLTNTPALFDGAYSSLTGTPSLFSGDYDDLTNKPALFDGAYSSLTGTPALFSGVYADLTSKPTLFDGDYNSLTNKPTYKEAVTTGTGPGGNNQADSLVLAGLNPTENIPSTYGGDLILKGGFGGANNDLFGEVRIKSGTIGSNFEWHFTVDKKIKLPAGGDIVNSTGTSVLFSGSYVDLTNKPTIPTDVSDLTDTTSLLSSGGKIGYASGSTVTQTSNRGNGVAINALSGTIVTVNAGMVAGEIGTFPVANNQVDANNDIVLVQVVSPNLGNYNVIANPNSGIGGFYLILQNISGFPISAEAVTIRFIVIKAPSA